MHGFLINKDRRIPKKIKFREPPKYSYLFLESSYFCYLGTHAKFRVPSYLLSGRKERASERKKEEEEEDEKCQVLWPLHCAGACTPLGPKMFRDDNTPRVRQIEIHCESKFTLLTGEITVLVVVKRFISCKNFSIKPAIVTIILIFTILRKIMNFYKVVLSSCEMSLKLFLRVKCE